MDTELYSKLLNSSFRFLAVRPRSIKETKEFLRDKLKTWKASDDGSMEKVITRLNEMEYLDDAKFAEWLIASRRRHKPRGERFIRQELQQKGIEDDIIENSLKYEVNIGEDELTRARTAVQKVAEIWKNLSKQELRRKLFAFLVRRGFNMDIASKIVDEYRQSR